MSVPQALVLSAIQHITEGKPVSGQEISGEHTIVLTAAEREQVLKVLREYVREPAFRTPAEQTYRTAW